MDGIKLMWMFEKIFDWNCIYFSNKYIIYNEKILIWERYYVRKSFVYI